MDTDEKKLIDERLQALIKTTHDFQIKFTYYILAVNAACIGFSVNLNKDAHYSLYLIPFIVAVILWLVSFYSGIRELLHTDIVLQNNLYLLDNEKRGKDGSFYKEKFNKHNEKVMNFSAYKIWCFYLGTICFLIWYFLKIYTNQ